MAGSLSIIRKNLNQQKEKERVARENQSIPITPYTQAQLTLLGSVIEHDSNFLFIENFVYGCSEEQYFAGYLETKAWVALAIGDAKNRDVATNTPVGFGTMEFFSKLFPVLKMTTQIGRQRLTEYLRSGHGRAFTQTHRDALLHLLDFLNRSLPTYNLLND